MATRRTSKPAILADPLELQEVNRTIPWTEGSIAGKVVIIRKSALLPEYQLMDRRFKASGGFGCNIDSIGNAVFGTWLVDGESCRQERFQVEGIAANPDLPVVHYGREAIEDATTTAVL